MEGAIIKWFDFKKGLKLNIPPKMTLVLNKFTNYYHGINNQLQTMLQIGYKLTHQQRVDIFYKRS